MPGRKCVRVERPRSDARAARWVDRSQPARPTRNGGGRLHRAGAATAAPPADTAAESRSISMRFSPRPRSRATRRSSTRPPSSETRSSKPPFAAATALSPGWRRHSSNRNRENNEGSRITSTMESQASRFSWRHSPRSPDSNTRARRHSPLSNRSAPSSMPRTRPR